MKKQRKTAKKPGKASFKAKKPKKPIIIAITGTPCTGKTSLAREMAKITGFKLIDGNEIIKKYRLSEGYDRLRSAKIVDSRRFARSVILFIRHDLEQNRAEIKQVSLKKVSNQRQKKQVSKKPKTAKFGLKRASKGYIVDSHMSHFLPVKSVKICIVTKTSINELNKRLKARQYKKAKLRENLDSEILEVCYVEALEAGHKVVVADGTKKQAKILAKEILKTMKI